MSKGKIIAVTVCSVAAAVGISAAAVVVCRRLFEKNYFSVADSLQ